jgi:hypothetical protein
MYASYKGGAYSRPGTRFVGYSAQTGRDFPPRLIPFQFNINQGLILEFGNFYMRVVLNGAQVTENPIGIIGVTQADPGVVTTGGSSGGLTATPLNTAIIASYAPGDTITLAGGVFTVPAVLSITDTILLSCALSAGGENYAPGDTITLAGGTHSVAAVATIVSTQAAGIGFAPGLGGSGGTPGPVVLTGTTGTGTPFQVNGVIGAGGDLVSVGSIINPGSYTVNPNVLPAHEPVTGGGLVGAEVGVAVGVGTFSISNGGKYTVNPAGNNFTQGSTTGAGFGATFQSAIFGPEDVTFSVPGVYTTFPSNPVQQASTSGGGIGAQFNVTSGSPGANGFSTGDWVFIDGVLGMTELNGQTFIITVLSPTTFSLQDVFGNNIDTTAFSAYISGGTVARIFTLTTIYAEADLEWIKFVQSADVMTLCCVNQDTGTEYPPQDLARLSDTDWVFTPVVPVTSIDPPTNAFLTGSNSGPAYYAYVVTSVAADGTESIASNVAYADLFVDIAATAGSVTAHWDPVPGAVLYNIYKAEPGFQGRLPVGVLFGFVGSAFGTQFVDSNIIADFQQVPPLHRDPFVRGQIIGAVVDNPGSGYTFANATITSGTGSGAVIEPVISNFGVVALLVVDNGGGYLPGDTISISGDGAGATAHLTIGPETGTYPSVPSYFQQRRVFGNTENNPDTYFMSQPGAFTNFDSRIPTIDSDAIIGSPWSLQVNGIQFFVVMPAGLLTMTGLSAWLLVGAGSFATNVQPISPSSQVAQPLAFSGCSPLLPPIKINYDILYVASKGSYYFDLPYQLYALSEPIDLTIFSSHLFDDFTLREHTWAETPFKLIWAVRNDGCLLSLTFLKQQQVAGWARHDTDGHFWSVASVVEPVIATPELGDIPAQKADATYVVVERRPG